jgi:hypothetical protein
MIDRKARSFVAAALLVVAALGFAPFASAEYGSINHTTATQVITAQAIVASGTFTQGQAGSNTRPFTALPKTVNQSAAFRGVGTSPNYKVELLITLDGTNYVKPEVGGDLGTYTDSNWHIVPLAAPVSIGHEFKFTELGGANTVTADALEASQ